MEYLHSETQASGAGTLREVQKGTELAEESLLVIFQPIDGYGLERADVESRGDVGVEPRSRTGVEDPGLVGGEAPNSLASGIIDGVEEIIVPA